MKNLKYLFFFGVIIFLTNCGNDDIPKPTPELKPTLPSITSNGSNTFGAMVNGEVWLPKYHTTLGFDLYTPRGGYMEIDLPNLGLYRGSFGFGAGQHFPETNTDIILSFFVDTIYTTGRYEFTSFVLPDEYDTYYKKYRRDNDNTNQPYDAFYFIKNPNVNQLNLTKLDTVNNIISGTFEVDLIDTITGDIMEIRDGRFDLTYD